MTNKHQPLPWPPTSAMTTWNTGVDLRFAPSAGVDAIVEFIDGGPIELCPAHLDGQIKDRKLHIALDAENQLDVARWVRYLRRTGLFI